MDTAHATPISSPSARRARSSTGGTYTADPSRKPATIDFTHRAGEMKGKIWRGIYELSGDTLRICDNAGDVSKARPAAFGTEAGSGQVMLNFKRAGR